MAPTIIGRQQYKLGDIALEFSLTPERAAAQLAQFTSSGGKLDLTFLLVWTCASEATRKQAEQIDDLESRVKAMNGQIEALTAAQLERHADGPQPGAESIPLVNASIAMKSGVPSDSHVETQTEGGHADDGPPPHVPQDSGDGVSTADNNDLLGETVLS